MKSNKTLGIVIWIIGLLLVHLIVFVVPDYYTTDIWIGYGFTLFAFLSQLALWLWIWRREISASSKFLYTSTLMISIAYLLLQTLLILASSLFFMPIKVSVMANALLAVVMGIAILLSLVAKNAIRKLDGRQRNNHSVLRG